MKKILSVLFIIILLSLVSVSAYAQTPTPGSSFPDPGKIITNITGTSIPGLDCGVGGATDGTEKCCNSDLSQVKILPKLPVNELTNLFSNTPIIGGLIPLYQNISVDIEKRVKALEEFQKNNPGSACIYGKPDSDISSPSCKCVATDLAMNRTIAQLCYNYLSKSKELGACVSCAATNGMWTGIGCVPLNLQSFISNFLLSMGIGLGGILALLCIIYSAFMIQTSRGNPEKIKKAQENLTSCIMGLILIIFSVFILKLIGVDILRIPFK